MWGVHANATRQHCSRVAMDGLWDQVLKRATDCASCLAISSGFEKTRLVYVSDLVPPDSLRKEIKIWRCVFVGTASGLSKS